MTTDPFALPSKRQSLPLHDCVPVPVRGPSKANISRNCITLHTLTLTHSKSDGMHCSVADVNKQNKETANTLKLSFRDTSSYQCHAKKEEEEEEEEAHSFFLFFFMLDIQETSKIKLKLSQDLSYLPAK